MKVTRQRKVSGLEIITSRLTSTKPAFPRPSTARTITDAVALMLMLVDTTPLKVSVNAPVTAVEPTVGTAVKICTSFTASVELRCSHIKEPL
jgi:hypothetical protein